MYVSKYTTYTWYLWSEAIVKSPGTRVIGGHEPPWGNEASSLATAVSTLTG